MYSIMEKLLLLAMWLFLEKDVFFTSILKRKSFLYNSYRVWIFYGIVLRKEKYVVDQISFIQDISF